MLLLLLLVLRSSATLELEASTLQSQAAKLAASHGWDVRALLLHLSSGMKYLEWAHSFAGQGVGVASISKQQAYKNNLTEAANTVRSCAKLAKQQMVQRASQRKQAGTAHPPAMTAVDYAFAAVRLLADKLEAVANTNLLFVKTQGFNTTLRNLTLNTSPAASAAVAAAAAAESAGTGGSAAAAAAGGPGSMAAPAARAPSVGAAGARGRAAAGAGGYARGGAGGPVAAGGGGGGGGGDAGWQAGVFGGPSPGESGTQNSASSAVELVPVAAEGSSRANDRTELADGVAEYIIVTDHWAAVAEANEAYLQKTGRAAAVAAAAEAAAEAKAHAAAKAGLGSKAGGTQAAAMGGSSGVAGSNSSTGSGQAAISAAALAAAHRVGQLILAVGFEAGLWDLPSVLDIARQAADAIMNLVEVHGAPAGRQAAPQLPGAGAGSGPGAAAGGGAGGGPGGGGAGGSGLAGGDGSGAVGSSGVAGVVAPGGAASLASCNAQQQQQHVWASSPVELIA